MTGVQTCALPIFVNAKLDDTVDKVSKIGEEFVVIGSSKAGPFELKTRVSFHTANAISGIVIIYLCIAALRPIGQEIVAPYRYLPKLFAWS